MDTISYINVNGVTVEIADAEARTNITGMQVDKADKSYVYSNLEKINSDITSIEADVQGLFTAVGTPLTAATAAAMTDHSKIYVYTGSETGYTSGNWYYWNESEWVSGGVYNSTAFTADTTLTVPGAAADSAAAGAEIKGVKSDLSHIIENVFTGSYELVDHLYINTSNEKFTASGLQLSIIVIPISARTTYTIWKETTSVMRVATGTIATPAGNDSFTTCVYHSTASSDPLTITSGDTDSYMYIQLWVSADDESMKTVDAHVKSLIIYKIDLHEIADAVSSLYTSLAPVYDNTVTYAIGDYCTRENKLYRCKTNIDSPEDFTSSHWLEVSIYKSIPFVQNFPDGEDANTVVGKSRMCYIGYSNSITNGPNDHNGARLLLAYTVYNGTNSFLTIQVWINATRGEILSRYYSSSTHIFSGWINLCNGMVDSVFSIFTNSYDKTRTYARGQLVMYNDSLYMCTVPVRSAEDFNAEKWQIVTEAYLSNIGSLRWSEVTLPVEKSYSLADSNGTLFKLMTYNVAQLTNDSNVGLYYANGKFNYYNFKRMLYENPVDVIATQEDPGFLDHGSMDETNDTISALAYLFEPLYCGRLGNGPTIYGKDSVGLKTYQFTNILYDGGTASITVRRKTVQRNEKTLYVYSLHLTNTSYLGRLAQLEAAISGCLTQDNPTYFVFMGDFNTGYGGVEIGSAELEAEIAGLRTLESRYNGTLANGNYLGWIRTHKASYLGGIDNAFVSNTCVITKFKPLGEWYPLLYSDHYPVLLDVTCLDL